MRFFFRITLGAGRPTAPTGIRTARLMPSLWGITPACYCIHNKKTGVDYLMVIRTAKRNGPSWPLLWTFRPFPRLFYSLAIWKGEKEWKSFVKGRYNTWCAGKIFSFVWFVAFVWTPSRRVQTPGACQPGRRLNGFTLFHKCWPLFTGPPTKNCAT